MSENIVITHMNTLIELVISKTYIANPDQDNISSVTCESDEPWADFTVCIPDQLLEKENTILDTNNYPEILSILIDAGVVEDTGFKVSSGFCTYPVVKVLKTCL